MTYFPKRKAKLLVVDDEPAITQLVQCVLETSLPTEVQVRNSGRLALDDLGPLDLLMTDYFMPGMDGTELAAAARMVQKELPILIMTGHPEEARAATEGLRLDRVGILPKPFDHEMLVEGVRHFLPQGLQGKRF